MDPHFRLTLRGPAASPHEAAAAIAAVEQFLRDTVPPAAPPAPEGPGPWARAALVEGVDRDPGGPSPWGDPHVWG